MTVKEVKNLFFICDSCKVTKLLHNVFDDTLPDNWKRTIIYPIADGYSPPSYNDLSWAGTVRHYCPPCVEKMEIREVFK